MVNTQQPLISPTFQFVTSDGVLTGQALRLLQTLLNRTGGSQGYDLSVIAEEAAGALQAAENLFDVPNKGAGRTNLGLGTASTHASTDFATAAQGSLAGSALQPNTDISVNAVSVSGVQVVGARETGWTASTGTATRTGLDGTWTQSISNPPTQAEVEAVVTQLQLVTQTCVALLNDAADFGWIGT